MRIAAFGAVGPTCQLPRIITALRDLNHTVETNPSDGDFDLAYSNDPNVSPPFSDISNINAKVKIKNILDIPVHLIENGSFGEAELADLRKGLLEDSNGEISLVTCISETTKRAVKKYLDIDVDRVILNPVQDLPITRTTDVKKFIFVGRANDSNKRLELAARAFLEFRETLEGKDYFPRIEVFGSEDPGNRDIFDYRGVVSNLELSEAYSSSRFLLFPSRIEGIGLPMIEAASRGCIPLTSFDNECAGEFLDHSFSSLPSPEPMAKGIRDLHNEFEKLETYISWHDFFRVEFSGFDPESVAKKIIDLGLSRCV
jgi:glycosyltransferase involved in cell wall biosynthesis